MLPTLLILHRFAIKAKPTKTYYQVLQLHSSASQKQIKSHYIKLAKIYHPDVYKGSDKSRFDLIKTAYDTLSSREKRKVYDTSIGIGGGKKESREGMEGQGEDTTEQQEASYAKMKKKPRVKLDYSFDKAEAESIDLDQKYHQFFNKKVETPFQEIRIKQNQWWQQMTEKERLQKTFTTIYNNPKHQIRTIHQDSYKNILDEQIRESNRYQEEVKEHQRRYHERRTEENIRKTKRRYYRWFLLLGVLTLPVIASVATRERIVREEEGKIVARLNEIYDEDEEEKLRKRFQY